ncbi:MAG: ATP-binding protein [Oculatellaceae cyanobacterium Prado106]|jgi:anti-sigma regulatory factor (Ser/Thr protein kinase)|nr:ATP-binding protein [Oculatellaceae cyanobacterium Prado106]
MNLQHRVSADLGVAESPSPVKIKVSSDLNVLAQVLAWFDQFKQPTLPYSVWLQCQLALAEGFTNAVRHAHRDKPTDTPVEIEVTTRSQAIEIRIWDSGSGFDLEHSLSTRPSLVEILGEGGRGLKIIQKTSDVFSYTRTSDHRNCLLMIKNFLPMTSSLVPG